jgi:hypothetical protein
MTDKNHKRVGERRHHEDALDRELDAALAKYASVEPRAGIEERVLAHLRAERTRVADRGWWRWALAATAAALIVVAVAVISNSARPSRPANRPLATTQHLSNPGTQMAKRRSKTVGRRGGGPVRRTNRHPADSTVVVAAAPKLDQFPSPQPLSEQEEILVSYVSEYPEHAALIARARMEVLRRDREEELREEGEDNKANSQSNERN